MPIKVERLLAPHRRQVGLEYPDHRELGHNAACACEAEIVPDVIGLEGGNTDQENNTGDEMDTMELGALAPGAIPLVTRFSKSANPKAMLDLVEGEYNQELLSSRLQGNAVKEGFP